MNLLYYNDLNYSKVSKQFDKVIEQLGRSDFNAAEVRKMPGTSFYRAKLDYENRLLFKIAKHGNKKYLLLLEVIYNHDYSKSRFLRGAKIDETKCIELKSPDAVNENEIVELSYVNPALSKFHLLDKFISFDEFQEEVFRVKPPVIIIGSAGSGKTALTLEKLKTLKGRVLYVTLSPFLVENSANLYYANHYENEMQEIDFMSFSDYCSTLKILQGHEMDQRAFEQWMQTRAHVYGIKDVHKLFEEFRGVLSGAEVDKPFLSRNEYLELGVRRSIFLGADRNRVYDVFEKYLDYMQENGFYDLNIISYNYLKICEPAYDFIVVDEMQDFTNIQLFLVLKSLNEKGSFILCGDSNQIVHPNFFSWTNVKTMFYKQDMGDRDVKILKANFRNSAEITALANRLLKIKNARFGSIDKESTYLIQAVGNVSGQVVLLNDDEKVRRMLNEKTSRSTKFAVLVMRQEDKAGARKLFKTPLLFSIHESKGLEYENVIILNFISDNTREFDEITQKISDEDLLDEGVAFSRFRDKTDKSLDTYKFFINSLYVAITRGIKNIYLVEASQKHRMLQLLQLVEAKSDVKISGNVSSAEEWKKEADKLEKQGKKEHAEEIRQVFFSQQAPDWEPLTNANLEKLKKEALDPVLFNKKAKDRLFAYALIYDEFEIIDKLAKLKYRRAEDKENEFSSVFRKYYSEYKNNDLKQIGRLIEKYGLNYRDQFNLTPLLAAIQSASTKAIRFLLEQGADITLMDNRGKNALRSAIGQKYQKTGNSQTTDLVFAAFTSDTLRLKIDDKLVLIPSRKFEYILLNFFLTTQSQLPSERINIFWQRGFTAKKIEESIEDYPESMVPGFRKKKSYISAMLSKNEKSGTNPYNHKIMIRTNHGEYLLNSDIEMMVNEQWTDVYSVMGIEKLVVLTEKERLVRINQYYEKIRKEDERKQKEIDKQLAERASLQSQVAKTRLARWYETFEPEPHKKQTREPLSQKPEKSPVTKIKKDKSDDSPQFKITFDDEVR
jgi:hypothetical protein